ncbi:hypothetical protein COCNU_07G013310 [Cocos nucifera]|uniref:Uncharacterized protein n=1 Tax=Cocos nucifera TaxID=13894 RepID=A0A8K0N5Y1_COCNU|nr:hypothetical protein COCNU_07G013310 [Cocos nucifera]
MDASPSNVAPMDERRNDEVGDDDAKSDGSDSGEFSVEEDVPPYEVPLILEFGLVDTFDNDEAASHGVMPEHPFFGGNEELGKKIVFRSKKEVQHAVKQYAIRTHHPFKIIDDERLWYIKGHIHA